MVVRALDKSLRKYGFKHPLPTLFFITWISFMTAAMAASTPAHNPFPCVLNHVVSRRKKINVDDTESYLAQVGVSWPFKHASKLYWILPAHLVADSDNVTIVTCEQKEVSAEILVLSSRLDLAILRPKLPTGADSVAPYPTVFELQGFMKTKFSVERFPAIGLYFPRSYGTWNHIAFRSNEVDLLGFETGLPGIQRLLVLNEVASPPSTSGSLAVFPKTQYSSSGTVRTDPDWGMLVQTELFSNRSVAIPVETMIRFASSALSRPSLAPVNEMPSSQFAGNYERSSNTSLILADRDHLYIEMSEPCSPSSRQTSDWMDVGGGSWGNGGGPGSVGSSIQLSNIITRFHEHYFSNTFYQPETAHQLYLERPSCFDQGLIIKRIERNSGKIEISRMLFKPRGSGWHRPTLASFLRKDIEQIVYKKFGRNLGDQSPSSNLMDYIKHENDPTLHELTYNLMCSNFNGKQYALQLERKGVLQASTPQDTSKTSLHELVYQESRSNDFERGKRSSSVSCSEDKKRFVIEIPGPSELTFRLSLEFGTMALLEVLDQSLKPLTTVKLDAFAAWSQGGRLTTNEGHIIDFFFELFPPFPEQKSPLLHLNFLELKLHNQLLGPVKISIFQ